MVRAQMDTEPEIKTPRQTLALTDQCLVLLVSFIVSVSVRMCLSEFYHNLYLWEVRLVGWVGVYLRDDSRTVQRCRR